MEDGSHKTALLVGVVAAAAGLAIASYVYYWRVHTARARETAPLRGVTEVLTDCYAKMREIQGRLADLGPMGLQPQSTKG